MNSFAISGIVFACVFGGAMASTALRDALPPDHLSADSKRIVTLGMGLVATMSALVLGLLVSSAKSYYDTQSAELTAASAKVVLLDRVLTLYGPETKETRDLLRGVVSASLDRLWPQERRPTSQVAPSTTGAEDILVKIQTLSPQDDTQRSIKGQALNMVIGLAQTRWLMYEQGTNSVSRPILVIVVFWLTAIFISFGLFAPRNLTVTAALFVSGLSVSGAIFLILELYTPFGGLTEISSAPVRFALAQLAK
jgi:hypothetical protein